MRKLGKIFIFTSILFVFISASLSASLGQHEKKVQSLIKQGFYDQAAQETQWVELKNNFLEKYLKTYGTTNAFLSLLAVSLLLLRKKIFLFPSSNKVNVIRHIPPSFN
ncbi:MAG: hypothetical protein HYW47_06060 [Deltaproteobacteria bacterium]|nr:hypothetical protein [Deltaproteobacteria bacterium]